MGSSQHLAPSAHRALHPFLTPCCACACCLQETNLESVQQKLLPLRNIFPPAQLVRLHDPQHADSSSLIDLHVTLHKLAQANTQTMQRRGYSSTLGRHRNRSGVLCCMGLSHQGCFCHSLTRLSLCARVSLLPPCNAVTHTCCPLPSCVCPQSEDGHVLVQETSSEQPGAQQDHAPAKPVQADTTAAACDTTATCGTTPACGTPAAAAADHKPSWIQRVLKPACCYSAGKMEA